MKMSSTITLNLRTEEADKKVIEANKLAMRDTIVEVLADSIRPPSPILTGNNRRSMVGEVSGMGGVASGGEGQIERMVDESKIEGAVYSTSGYGGFLETGTSKMPAQPYIKPAVDRHFTAEKFGRKVKEHLE